MPGDPPLSTQSELHTQDTASMQIKCIKTLCERNTLDTILSSNTLHGVLRKQALH